MDGKHPTVQPQSWQVAPVLAGLCIFAFLGATWITADVSPLRPDTASYLYFDPSRPIGYPAFLWMAGKLGGVLLAVQLQMLVLAASLFLLGLAFFHYTGRPLLSLLFQLALVLSPEMWKFAAMLITEATASAAVALWCAQLLRTVRRSSIRSFALLTVISGAAMLVKPSLAPLFVGSAVPVLGLATWRDRLKAMAIIAAGLVAALTVTPLANLLLHGSPNSGSPVARGVLQHTLFCTVPRLPGDEDSAFVDRYARLTTDQIEMAPSAVQPGLKRLYTGELRFGLIIPAIGRRHGLDAGWQTDPILWRIARERIAGNPTCYAESVASSYFAIATYKAYSSRDVERLRRHLRTQPPLTLPAVPMLRRDRHLAIRAAHATGEEQPAMPGQQNFDPPTGRPLPLIWTARLVYGSAALLGGVAILLLLAPIKLGPETRQQTICLAALGLSLHGIAFLTAIVELPLMRYTVPMWPIVCTLLGSAGVFAIERARRTIGRSEVST